MNTVTAPPVEQLDTELRQFLTMLFHEKLPAGLTINVRAVAPKGDEPTWNEFYGSVDDLIADRARLDEWNATRSIFVGTALRNGRDGSKAASFAVTSLWADIDSKDFVPHDGDPEKIEEGKVQIDAHLAAFEDAHELPVSLVIDTGAGAHAYWLFKDAYWKGGGKSKAEAWAADVAQIEGTLTAMQPELRSDKARLDISSMMRLPTFINVKYAHRPLARVTFTSEARYDFEAFAKFTPSREAVAPKPKVAPLSGLVEVGTRAVLQKIHERGLYIRDVGDKHLIVCPWDVEHSDRGVDTKTALFVEDGVIVGFKCLGGHCVGRTLADVKKVLGLWRDNTDTPPPSPAPQNTPVEDDPGGERYTDMANATRIAIEGAGKVAHVEEMKDKFYVYDGVRLNLEAKTAVVPYVKSIARRLYAEAAELFAEVEQKRADLDAQSGNMTKAAVKDALDQIKRLEERANKRQGGAQRLESRDGAYSAIELSKAEPSIRVDVDQLDANLLWLNTPSGTLDLETGELRPHEFTDYLTKVTGAVYDAGAACPRWDTFLAEVLPDPNVRAFIQRSVGYALTGLTNEHCIWFLYGTGRNGKTTFINAIRAVLGDYAASTKASTLMVKDHGDERRNDVAVLRGARFVSATEAEDGQHLAEALIKEVTGGDPVTARLLYAEYFTFLPTFKIMLAANHKPVVRGTDLGIWRRIHLVPFEVTVVEDQVDTALPAALAAEAPGILNWAVEGYRAWRAGGLQPPDAVRAATAAYRAESDPLADFFEERLIVEPHREVLSRDLFQAYQRWAEANGIKRPMTQPMLGRELRERGFKDGRGTRDGDRGKRWLGLGLRV